MSWRPRRAFLDDDEGLSSMTASKTLEGGKVENLPLMDGEVVAARRGFLVVVCGGAGPSSLLLLLLLLFFEVALVVVPLFA